MKGEQINLDFNQAKPAETEDERKRRLIESIRRKNKNQEPLNDEEAAFRRKEISELDDNPYQNQRTNN